MIDILLDICANHWGKLVAIATIIGGGITWLRVGRGADKITRAKQRIDHDQILHDQLERMSAKITQLYNNLMSKEAIIAYLYEECTCVHDAIEKYKEHMNNDK